jgi:hypothetical protein
MCLAEARTASVAGNRGEILEWLDRAERAPRFNPSEDASQEEQVTVFRSMAWELLGDMPRAKQLSVGLEPLDGGSFLAGVRAGFPPVCRGFGGSSRRVRASCPEFHPTAGQDGETTSAAEPP